MKQRCLLEHTQFFAKRPFFFKRGFLGVALSKLILKTMLCDNRQENRIRNVKLLDVSSMSKVDFK